MTSAAIYARVSSARQKKDQTIGSQTAALRQHAGQSRLEVPEEWVFEDEGHSGATLVRPGLEALRDLAAQGCLDVVLCYSPDRLARKFACQALLLEEFARAGVRVLGTAVEHLDISEDREKFYALLHALGIPCPAGGAARSVCGARGSGSGRRESRPRARRDRPCRSPSAPSP